MSSKVVEANAKVHSLAMAVAVSRVLQSSLGTRPNVACRCSMPLFLEINLDD
jgi:hypothetical protein